MALVILHFVGMIERAGVIEQEAKRWAMLVQDTVEVHCEDKFVRLEPCPITRITAEIEFPGTAVGNQKFSTMLTESVFKRELARARTFGFADQIEDLYERKLALGGSSRNAVLVDGETIVNEEGLRFHDEFVRHKVLDIVGDLSLAGVPIIGHFHGYKPGHALNQALLRKFMSSERSWSYVMLDDFEVGPAPACSCLNGKRCRKSIKELSHATSDRRKEPVSKPRPG